MCGIVGSVAGRNVTPLLLTGLKRLEYRGYDSAGVAVFDEKTHEIKRLRMQGKVQTLIDALGQHPINGFCGIAHTRWATHGKPCEANAHPQMSGTKIAVVHNGIIENHVALREMLIQAGFSFSSQTDTEVIAHLIAKHFAVEKDFLKAVQQAIKALQGAFAIGILHADFPDQLIAVRRGSPLVIGVGIEEHFLASDVLALLPMTHKFVYLQEGDVAVIKRASLAIFDHQGKPVQPKIDTSDLTTQEVSRGKHKHFMQKEIFEQSNVVCDTLEGRINDGHILPQILGVNAEAILKQVKRIQIVACGTSFHAAMTARYWLESMAKMPTQVEIASEFRYRKNIVEPDTLFITLSQSGETADTLAALAKAKQQNYLSTLAICNVPASSLVRESELCLMTRAGIEIGVASTKAFTTQLTALLMLTAMLSQQSGDEIITQLLHLPHDIKKVLELDKVIEKLAVNFANKDNAIFLGRGIHYPIAMEGALKLKEISYIHAEAYPAGELKHGPLALVDENMPVIAIAPNDELLEKLQSNLSEVSARSGELIVFADQNIQLSNSQNTVVIHLPLKTGITAPILFTIPLQLLAYHVAVIKGTDVDQPRNLAKSVTVE